MATKKHLWNKFQQLYDDGLDDKQIAHECDCSFQAVTWWRSHMGLPFLGNIECAKALHSSSLCMSCARAYVKKCRKIAFSDKVYDEAIEKEVAGNNSGETRMITVVTKCSNYEPDRDVMAG